MASSLEDDLSCPVCCELYQDPRLLACGHSFCRLCVGKHWALNPARTCPVCRQTSPQDPLTNLVLRNACESYQSEKERGRGGEARCSVHDQKFSFFCKTDQKVICSECRRYAHSCHRVQPLEHTVRQRKARVKAALRPAEKALEALRKGTTQDTQLSKHIESQALRAEKLIRKEFEKFHQFLHDEEEARVSALKKEKDHKRKMVHERAEREIQALSERVTEVEDELENDGAAFLQNFDFILQRAEYTELDSQISSESLINMPEHVGNLGYRVWEKMKDADIFRYYPVVLDPNNAPTDFSVSDDLVSVGRSSHHHLIPISDRWNNLILGSKGYTDDDVHWWDVEVGDSKHWTIGVCQHSAAMNRSVKSLSPESGFWGLSRHGDSYRLLLSRSNSFRLKRKVRTVRVLLGWRFFLHQQNIWHRQKMLYFLDAGDHSMIAFTSVPTRTKLFPFLVPDERFSRLRIAPASVMLQAENTFPSERSKTRDIIGAIIWMIVGFVVGVLLQKE